MAEDKRRSSESEECAMVHSTSWCWQKWRCHPAIEEVGRRAPAAVSGELSRLHRPISRSALPGPMNGPACSWGTSEKPAKAAGLQANKVARLCTLGVDKRPTSLENIPLQQFKTGGRFRVPDVELASFGPQAAPNRCQRALGLCSAGRALRPSRRRNFRSTVRRQPRARGYRRTAPTPESPR